MTTRRTILTACAGLGLTAVIRAAGAQPAQDLYVNSHYDPEADPRDDIERACRRAGEEGKRVLVIVGGDWCVWCLTLDRFLRTNAQVRAAFTEAFVLVKVYAGPDNDNAAFLHRYRRPPGYPDFIVLDASAAYMGAQNTSELESGHSYSAERMIEFAHYWRDLR